MHDLLADRLASIDTRPPRVKANQGMSVSIAERDVLPSVPVAAFAQVACIQVSLRQSISIYQEQVWMGIAGGLPYSRLDYRFHGHADESFAVL